MLQRSDLRKATVSSTKYICGPARHSTYPQLLSDADTVEDCPSLARVENMVLQLTRLRRGLRHCSRCPVIVCCRIMDEKKDRNTEGEGGSGKGNCSRARGLEIIDLTEVRQPLNAE